MNSTRAATHRGHSQNRLDDPEASEQERLRKLEQLMGEQGYVRHAGGFWITPGSAPEEPGDNEDD